MNNEPPRFLQTTSVHTRPALRALAVIVGVGSLALLCGATGCASGRSCPQSKTTTLDELARKWPETTDYPEFGRPESAADRATSSRVRSALARNSEYRLTNVQVVTLHGVPYLSGVVASEAQRRRAGDIALHVEGVLAVANLITVTN